MFYAYMHTIQGLKVSPVCTKYYKIWYIIYIPEDNKFYRIYFTKG